MVDNFILPPYSDSPEHFLIIKDILEPEYGVKPMSSMNGVLERYYHFGFHGLVSFISGISKTDALKNIVLLSIFFSSLTPFTIYFLINSITNNTKGAQFGALLGGIGWILPFYGINWGKFPALLGVILLPLVFAYCYLWMDKQQSVKNFVFLTIGIVLIHTRMLIIIPIFILCVLTSKYLTGKWRTTFAIIFFLIFILSISISPGEYFRYLSLTSLLVLLVFPFAQKTFSGTTLMMSMFSSLLFLSSALILPHSYLKITQSLIDRPMLELILYIPLSVIGGLGFSGFIDTLSTKHQLFATRFQLLVVLLFLVLRISSDEYYPNPTTNFVSQQDIELLNWMNNNLPASSTVYIPAGTYGNDWGLDAGIWVEPLTGIRTIRIPSYLDKSPSEIIDRDCIKTDINQFLYIGTTEDSFNVTDFDHLVLKKSFEQAALYQLICE